VKAISFAAPIPTYLATLAAGAISPSLQVGRFACTRYGEVERPSLPSDEWVRVKVRLGGICGSDLAIVSLGTSPSASPFSSFPFVLGHENVGVVAEVGAAVREFAEGDRVTVNPLLCCEPRGHTPSCHACASGEHSRCAHFTDGAIPAGVMIGTTRSLGGSWGEEFVAHSSQVVRVPETMSDEEAVLVEPFACCVHAVRGAGITASERVLVIGAGSMGLLMTAALRSVAGARVAVLARHPFQAALAGEIGADEAVLSRGDYHDAVARVTGTRLHKPIIGRRVGSGGVAASFVCVDGPRAVEDAMRFTRQGGTVTLLGNVSTLRGLDWTPLWFKELTLRGTLAYGDHAGTGTNAFVEAARLIAERRVNVGGLVTHAFALQDYRRALQVARSKGTEKSVKVVLKP
jgi:threonine dehydrogenase-like Zn-dependent dehydrogenase